MNGTPSFIVFGKKVYGKKNRKYKTMLTFQLFKEQ
jgi:hypothetical protein